MSYSRRISDHFPIVSRQARRYRTPLAGMRVSSPITAPLRAARVSLAPFFRFGRSPSVSDGERPGRWLCRHCRRPILRLSAELLCTPCSERAIEGGEV